MIKMFLSAPHRHMVLLIFNLVLDEDERSDSHPGQFTHKKQNPVPTEQHIQWGPQSFWTFRKRDKSLVPSWELKNHRTGFESHTWYMQQIQKYSVIQKDGLNFVISLYFKIRNWQFQRQMLCVVGGWMLKRRRNSRCTAVADSVLMNPQTPKIVLCSSHFALNWRCCMAVH